jgi:hypothetical protein
MKLAAKEEPEPCRFAASAVGINNTLAINASAGAMNLVFMIS